MPILNHANYHQGFAMQDSSNRTYILDIELVKAIGATEALLINILLITYYKSAVTYDDYVNLTKTTLENHYGIKRSYITKVFKLLKDNSIMEFKQVGIPRISLIKFVPNHDKLILNLINNYV
jgi:hypothetical protein